MVMKGSIEVYEVSQHNPVMKHGQKPYVHIGSVLGRTPFDAWAEAKRVYADIPSYELAVTVPWKVMENYL